MKNIIKENTFIPLTNDLLFKETLAEYENRDFLEYFLETLLDIPRGTFHQKLVVDYESPMHKGNYKEKTRYGDLIVRYNNTIINIEMYSTFNKKQMLKSFNYATYLYSDMDIGEDYSSNKQVIQINLVDNVSENLLMNKVHSSYQDLEEDFYIPLLNDKIKIHYFRIDTVKTIRYNENEKINKLLKFIGARSEEERRECMPTEEEARKFHEWVRDYVHEEKRKNFYDDWQDAIYKENARERGLKEGREEGLKEGLASGRVEGRTEGLMLVAKNMIKDGMEKNKISNYTGLSLEQINKLSY